MTTLMRSSRATFPKTGNAETDKVLDEGFNPAPVVDEQAPADPKAKTGAPGTLAALLAQALDGNLYEFKARANPKDADIQVMALLAEAERGGHTYSLARGINNAIERRTHGPVSGLEFEVHKELARITDRRDAFFLVPWTLPFAPREQRALTVGAGVGSIPVQLPGGMLVDILRARLCMAALGGEMLRLNAPGLVSLPIKSGALSTQWIAESTSATASAMKIGQAKFDPCTISATSSVSRRLLTLIEPGGDQMIVNDFITSLASAVDIAAVAGSGTGGTPLGLLRLAGMQTATITADSGNGGIQTYVDLVKMEGLLGQVDGDSEVNSRVGFLSSPLGRSALRRVDLGGATATGRFVWTSRPMWIDGEVRPVDSVLGHRALASSAVPSNLSRGTGTALTAAALANFADHLTVIFGPLQLIVNPYAQSTNTEVLISAFQDVACGFRRAQSVVLMNGIVTS